MPVSGRGGGRPVLRWVFRASATDRTIHFPVKGKPDGETVVTYAVKYTW